MAGRPRLWYPFIQNQCALTHQFTNCGRIRDRHRHELNDGHYFFRDNARADVLAREWMGRPSRGDCVFCGRFVPVASRYRAPPRRRAVGGGPPHQVVHLNGDVNDCARMNLAYGPDLSEERRHAWLHAELSLRQPASRVPAESLPRVTFRPEPYDRPVDAYCWSSPFKIRQNTPVEGEQKNAA